LGVGGDFAAIEFGQGFVDSAKLVVGGVILPASHSFDLARGLFKLGDILIRPGGARSSSCFAAFVMRAT
jgi:hypothetical protein